MEKKTREKTDEEKAAARRPKIPTDYIESLADRIHQTQPTKEILVNTINGVWSLAFTRGVSWRMDGERRFREQREADFQKEWKRIQDEIWGIPPVKPEGNKKRNKKNKKSNKK